MAIHVPEPLAWPLAVIFGLTFVPLWSLLRRLFVAPYAAPICDLRGKVCVVTGGNTGIGYETAVGLAKRGATVKIACRDATRGRDAAARAAAAVGTGAGTVEFVALDLGDLDSVRACAASLAQCDILVCNGGINSLAPAKTTREVRDCAILSILAQFGAILRNSSDASFSSRPSKGYSAVFGVNYVGHQVLVFELQRRLTVGRIVLLSSVMHRWAAHDAATLSDPPYNTALGQLDHNRGYSESKLNMVLLAVELNRRAAAAGGGPVAAAVDPGAVRSDIWRHTPGLLMWAWDLLMRATFLTPAQGAAPSIHAATLPTAALAAAARAKHAPYFAPYPTPDFCPLPFEMMGPFCGACACAPRLPAEYEAVAARVVAAVEKRV